MYTSLMKLEDGSLQFAVQNEPILNVKFEKEISKKTNKNWFLITYGNNYKMHLNFAGNCLNGIYTLLYLSDNFFPKTYLENYKKKLEIIKEEYYSLRVV